MSAPWLKTAGELALLAPAGAPRVLLAMLDERAVGWGIGEVAWPPVGWLVEGDADRQALQSVLIGPSAPQTLLTRADLASIVVDPGHGALKMLTALWLHLQTVPPSASEPAPSVLQTLQTLGGMVKVGNELLLTLLWGIQAQNLYGKALPALYPPELQYIHEQTQRALEATRIGMTLLLQKPTEVASDGPASATDTVAVAPLPAPSGSPAAPLAPGGNSSAPSATPSAASSPAFVLPERPFGYLNRVLETKEATRVWEEGWYGAGHRYL